MNSIKSEILILLVIVISSGCRTATVEQIESGERRGGWNGNQYIRLDSGYIEGRGGRENTWTWKGVPYAAPPVGELRWKAPRPVDTWFDVLQTSDFASPASQLLPFLSGLITGSEDCLYLNVWRPKSHEEKLPVYVWIHGGGNSIGRSSLEDYQGYAVASRSNVIFVSVAYRLGPLGWFRHPSLYTGDPLDDSGNYGLLDIIAALKWVQNNIEAFGGDPGNVLLSGESAGANNTLSLMLSPEAEGLFHKAIVQSGYKQSVSIRDAEAQADELLAYLMKKKGLELELAGDDEIKRILLESSPVELFNFYDAGQSGMIDHLYHIEDGNVFPKNGYRNFSSEGYAVPVPMIIGSNKDETKLFLFFDKSLSWKSPLYNYAAEVGSLGFRDNGVNSVVADISRNENRPPVYVYRFDWGSVNSRRESPLPGDYGSKLGAMHTMEIPFFMGTDYINGLMFTGMLFRKSNYESRKLLSGAVMNYTSNFIRTGNPNIGRKNVIRWPEWKENNETIILDADKTELMISTSGNGISASERLRELREELEPEEYRKLLEIIIK